MHLIFRTVNQHNPTDLEQFNMLMDQLTVRAKDQSKLRRHIAEANANPDKYLMVAEDTTLTGPFSPPVSLSPFSVVVAEMLMPGLSAMVSTRSTTHLINNPAAKKASMQVSTVARGEAKKGFVLRLSVRFLLCSGIEIASLYTL